MSNIRYISIKTVLYELSTLVPERYLDETLFLEWAYQGVRRLDLPQKYETCVVVLPVIEHIIDLPEDIKYLVQLAYKKYNKDIDETAIRNMLGMTLDQANTGVIEYLSNSSLPQQVWDNATWKNMWTPMRPSTNTFFKNIICNPEMFPTLKNRDNTQNSDHEYTIRHDNTVLTSLKEGVVMLSYLRHPLNDEGDILIPDVEEVREALMHYCLWKYWLRKSLIGETGSQEERIFHKTMFGIMKTKAAGVLNQPDVGTLENLMNQHTRLIPRRTRFNSFFQQLGSQEKMR